MSKQNPTFFIGLGGHGSDIVDKLAKQVKNRPDWSNIADLNHFIAIDTDKGDLAMKKFIPEGNQVCISNFDKYNFQMKAFGESFQGVDEKLASWLPNPDAYTFRKTAGKGAGQVRLESRLGMYYNVAVEQDLKKVIRNCINRSIRDGNAFRRDDLNMRFFIFGSVAGGTGSGAFLTTSYLVQSLVDKPWTPHVTMFLSLPTLFREKVGSLYKNVCVNGYAALKELEFLTKKMGYENDPSYPYRFGGEDHEGTVSTSPAGLLCIVDRPTKISLENVPQAIADAAYLLVFTKMLSSVEGELDNFEAEAKELSLNAFSSRYGTVGSHVLLFPREDILEYATRRKMVDILRENLAFSGKTTNADGTVTDFSVNYDDPKFKKKSEAAQNKEIDDKFFEYINYKKEEEIRDETPGMFRNIVGKARIANPENDEDEERVVPEDVNGPVLGDGETTLWDKFFTITEQWITDLNDKINLRLELDSKLRDTDPTVTKKVQGLKQQYAKLSTEIRKDAETKSQDIISGNFFKRFFKEHNVNPIAQRYFLIHLSRLHYGIGPEARLHIPPFQYGGKDYLAHKVSWPPPNINEMQQEWNTKLLAASQQSFFEKLTDRDNEKFKGRARGIMSELEDQMNQSANALRFEYWQLIQNALRSTLDKMTAVFRAVGKTAFERLKEEDEMSRKFLQNPASVNPNAQVAQFHILAEALRDDKKGRRLWDCFYIDKLSGTELKRDTINDIIVEGFAPIDELGQTRAPGANEVVLKIKKNLTTYLRDQFQSKMNELNMTAEEAVILENQYLVAMDEVYKPGEPDSAQVDLFSPTYSRRQRDLLLHSIATDPSLVNKTKGKIAEKIRRIENEICVLANVPAHHFAGEKPAMDSIYYSLEDAPTGGDGNSIRLRDIIESNFGTQLRKARTENDVDKNRREDASQLGDKDRIIFLYAQFNLPLFAFDNILNEMEPHYKKERARQEERRREGKWVGYRPSHTEWDWEIDRVPLVDLNPMEMKAANEKQKRLADVQNFFKGFYFEAFKEDESGAVSFDSVTGFESFSANREEGFHTFLNTDPRTFSKADKEEYLQLITDKWKAATKEDRFFPAVIQRLQEHLQHAKVQDRLARKKMLDGLSAYFQDEAEVIEGIIQELESKLAQRRL